MQRAKTDDKVRFYCGFYHRKSRLTIILLTLITRFSHKRHKFCAKSYPGVIKGSANCNGAKKSPKRLRAFSSRSGYRLSGSQNATKQRLGACVL